jgi:prophage regulatory protein
MNAQRSRAPTLLRLPEVCRRVGLTRSVIYRYIQGGQFPPPVRVGPRCSGWPDTEVDAWIAARIAERDRGEGGAQ